MPNWHNSSESKLESKSTWPRRDIMKNVKFKASTAGVHPLPADPPVESTGQAPTESLPSKQRLGTHSKTQLRGPLPCLLLEVAFLSLLDHPAPTHPVRIEIIKAKWLLRYSNSRGNSNLRNMRSRWLRNKTVLILDPETVN